jgi:hypothetical protein
VQFSLARTLGKNPQRAFSHPPLEGAVPRLGTGDTYSAVRAAAPLYSRPTNIPLKPPAWLPTEIATIGTSFQSQDRFHQLPLGIAEFPSSSYALLLPALRRSGKPK